MTASPQRPTCCYCAKPFMPPARWPDTKFCEHCFYSGQDHSAQHADLILALDSIEGVKSATMDHMGGGCFALNVRMQDGRFICATEDDFSAVPKAGDPWGLVTCARNEDAFADGDAPLAAREGSFTDRELAEVIRAMIETTKGPTS